MLELDQRGVPGVMVATTAFKEAAQAQSDALGFTPAIAWVAHPIQNRTNEEIEVLADQVFDELLQQLTAS